MTPDLGCLGCLATTILLGPLYLISLPFFHGYRIVKTLITKRRLTSADLVPFKPRDCQVAS